MTRYAVAHVLHDGQVVGDEEVGQAQPLLQVVEQVDDLGLDRDVQGRDRFVADEDGGLGSQRPGHPDALALPPGELVRETVVVLRVRPTSSIRSCTRRRRSNLSPMRWIASGSRITEPTRRRALSEPDGSWKIICRCRRIGRSWE